MLIYLALAASIIGTLALSFWANVRIMPDEASLPMQWSLKGKVNWRAPRVIALFITPAIMVATTALVFVLGEGNPGERNASLLLIAAIGPPVEILYLFLLTRGFGEPLE